MSEVRNRRYRIWENGKWVVIEAPEPNAVFDGETWSGWVDEECCARE